MALPENDIPLGASESAPLPDPSLQRTPDAGVHLGMPTPQFLENGDCPDAGRSLEHRDHFGVPYVKERVSPPPLAWSGFLRWQPRILLDPVCGGCGKAGLGGRRGNAVVQT